MKEDNVGIQPSTIDKSQLAYHFIFCLKITINITYYQEKNDLGV